MGDSSDRSSGSDSQWRDCLTRNSLMGTTVGNGYPCTWKSVHIKRGEPIETFLSSRMSCAPRASRLLFNWGEKFSTSRKNEKNRIFRYVWMSEDELGGESTEEGEEEGQYEYVYQKRFSRDSMFRVDVDEYSIRRSVLPVREGRVGKKNQTLDGANSGKKLYGRKSTREVDPRMGRTPHGGRGAEEKRGNILLENAWKAFKLEEGTSFGGGPLGGGSLGGNPFAGGPFCSDPYLCYPLQFCRRDGKDRRHISKEPYKVLSAPNLVDDFYLNLVDWSRQNIIAVGLRDKLCVWNEDTSKGEEVFTLKRKKIKKKKKKKKNTQKDKKNKKSITSLRWNFFGNHLSVGLSNGVVQIWDLEKEVKIRKYRNHKKRVGALGWYYDTLTTGSKDNKIVCSDIRCKDSSYAQLTNHTSEVCGLQWNYQTKQLASGSNDNSVYIWEWRKCVPLFQLTKHTAAVKAMSWSPHKENLLATGGGSADKKIFLWNTSTGKCLDEVRANSQVSNIFWSKHTEEFVSTHSYSLGQVVLWKYPRLKKVSALSGHALRVLYGALSPDGESIVTGSPDETLRLWRVFPRGGHKSAGNRLENCLDKCLGSYLGNPYGSHSLTHHPPHLIPFSNCYEQVR
ncbi:cell division cycle protein 20 homolog, putative [Plasmodium knowlesi strain H]|uniref:Cell division cycle protein 20 homolog, putative n=3 Tax=Plasmodium knowlesi TaxID=5850 RepID=A0A5K1UUC7_PLAKH|nr:uncharacterized protein PKNH_0610900 [Plasmodium knowlesi strain H]OTN68348.1 putative Cell division cycle protein 20-like protein [Plasmodium knowlesi]CAA9987159.1 cell division cycle protein 20 homolog, putative [Plasmodium knowlesi strain H]SBO23915.1 cell division cycle protein 20 homolog, putative [Plasmodium knowlesi strain H]SBO25801.1 cell division cycle protein 20 homolog, putative [Plasmodium knowlesi strain H]VVS76633.1 cell division cycle protein 20 homolog, putative [Plasmodium|eukprot:XP_002261784.1 [Plasmodium knowlesi strain H]